VQVVDFTDPKLLNTIVELYKHIANMFILIRAVESAARRDFEGADTVVANVEKCDVSNLVGRPQDQRLAASTRTAPELMSHDG
jgi:hypothetical protein